MQMSSGRFKPYEPPYSPVVAKQRAWREYHLAVADLGPDHPKTQALWGRVQFHERRVPQKSPAGEAPTVAVIAWCREAGSDRLIWNRTQRRFRASLP